MRRLAGRTQGNLAQVPPGVEFPFEIGLAVVAAQQFVEDFFAGIPISPCAVQIGDRRGQQRGLAIGNFIADFDEGVDFTQGELGESLNLLSGVFGGFQVETASAKAFPRRMLVRGALSPRSSARVRT